MSVLMNYNKETKCPLMIEKYGVPCLDTVLSFLLSFLTNNLQLTSGYFFSPFLVTSLGYIFFLLYHNTTE